MIILSHLSRAFSYREKPYKYYITVNKITNSKYNIFFTTKYKQYKHFQKRRIKYINF